MVTTKEEEERLLREMERSREKNQRGVSRYKALVPRLDRRNARLEAQANRMIRSGSVSAKRPSRRPFKPNRKKHYVVISSERGVPCPRCGCLTEVREHDRITDKHLSQPYYYTRWFYCWNKQCRVTLHMDSRYIVWNGTGKETGITTLPADPAVKMWDGVGVPWED